MKTFNASNKENVLTLDQFRILNMPIPSPHRIPDSEAFMVRPPAKPQVLIVKKTKVVPECVKSDLD